MVFKLNNEIVFPDPTLAEPDGLLAIGGDLSIERLLLAYSYGIFPWYSFRDCHEPLWYCPHDRFVIFPNEIHVSHSMRTFLRNTTYEVSIDKAFEEVINQCSLERIEESGAWLGKDMIEAYTDLHKHGFAHSVEVWDNGSLTGGLYGVQIADCFFGESMFSKGSNTSKMALITLANLLKGKTHSFIDCQFETRHLKNMGGRHISYDKYMEIFNKSKSESLNAIMS